MDVNSLMPLLPTSNANMAAANGGGGGGLAQQHSAAAGNGSNRRDNGWLRLEVCREFLRNKCCRQDTECKYAHPADHVEQQDGYVVCCFDSLRNNCHRNEPPCKYLHPPDHLKSQLLERGKLNLEVKKTNKQMQMMNSFGFLTPNHALLGTFPQLSIMSGPALFPNLNVASSTPAGLVLNPALYDYGSHNIHLDEMRTLSPGLKLLAGSFGKDNGNFLTSSFGHESASVNDHLNNSFPLFTNSNLIHNQDPANGLSALNLSALHNQNFAALNKQAHQQNMPMPCHFSVMHHPQLTAMAIAAAQQQQQQSVTSAFMCSAYPLPGPPPPPYS